MNLPKVAISFITYNRPKEFKKVWASVQANLIYPRENLIWIVADDGSEEDYLPTPSDNVFIVRNKRGGLGVNWNSAIFLAEQKADFVLANQDDWLFTEPLDLRLGIMFLLNNPDYGMLRYHKTTGHTGLPHLVKEWNSNQVIHGYHHSPNEYEPAMLPYFELLPPFDNSDTYSPYSGGVHLRHFQFTKYYGGYLEGERFSASEADYMAKVNHSLRFNLQAGVRHRVALFPHYVESRFRDLTIGKSYRDTAIEAETLHA